MGCEMQYLSTQGNRAPTHSGMTRTVCDGVATHASAQRDGMPAHVREAECLVGLAV